MPRMSKKLKEEWSLFITCSGGSALPRPTPICGSGKARMPSGSFIKALHDAVQIKKLPSDT